MKFCLVFMKESTIQELDLKRFSTYGYKEQKTNVNTRTMDFETWASAAEYVKRLNTDSTPRGYKLSSIVLIN
jgi:hypothetical protein